MFLFIKGTNGQRIPSKIAVKEQLVNIFKRTMKYFIVQGKSIEKEQFALSREEK